MLSQPVFNAGKTRASIEVAKEQAVQSRLAYKSTILGALRDVEDALARLKSEKERRTQLVEAVAAAQGSLAIADDQYKVGLVTYINVYAAQNTLLEAQDQLIQSDAQAASDLIALYKALGGGWSS
jgi:outer membrane protein TolC